VIRHALPADANAIAEIYGAVVRSSPISFEVDPPSADEMAGRMAAVQAYAPWLVLEREGAVAGYAYASRHRDRAAYQWSVDVSVYVHAAHRRGGVGRALYTSLLSLARLQGFYVAHAGITLPNDGSVALHESLGFRPVGVFRAVGYKLGAWHDVGWWRLALRPPSSEPAPPRAIGEASRDPSWAAALVD
jgi:phosphinothricin acetyltransferase